MGGVSMSQGYLSRTWHSLKATKNWFGKLCLLGLVAMIPVFGAIVVQGYLYGWARDAAWRMDNPLPSRIFGNEDGHLYRRGFFALVISVAMTLAVSVASFLFFWTFGFISGSASSFMMQALPDFAVSALSALAIPSLIGVLSIFLAFFVVAFGAQFFIWVGSMRMSIYGTLSSGFQLPRIWAMIRRSPAGLLKIVIGQFVAGLAIGTAAAIVWFVVVFVGIFVSLFAAGALDYSGSFSPAFDGLTAIGAFSTAVLALFVVFVSCTLSVAIQAFVCRALGYWTAEFNVAEWGSQDDLLPFERERERDAGDARG